MEAFVKHMKSGKTLLLGGMLAIALGGAQLAFAAMPALIGKAVLTPTSGSKVQGWLKFSATGSSLRVTGEVNGLTPGTHGFHVHEFGDCASADGSSAGGHYAAVTSQKHGSPTMPGHHTGDMGNITADANGVAKIDATFTVPGGVATILGRGLIVHEKGDDMKTQPSGASGNRLACGVIGVAKN